MTKFKTITALSILGLCVSACGPAGTEIQASDDDADSREEGGAFSPASGSTADAGSAKSDDASPESVAPSPPSPEGDDSGDEDAAVPTPSEPSEEPVADTGTTSDTGSGEAKDSGSALDSGPKDSGSAVADTAPTAPTVPSTPSASCAALAADLSARLLLPQSKTPESEWKSLSGMGPNAATYPAVAIPAGCDRVTFMRARVIAAAKQYIGLPYQHHHVPGWNPSHGPGLDCSNYTSWVYNFGLGIKFTSNITEQGAGPGRKLASNEKLEPGDLLYLADDGGSGTINHAMIYIDETHIIDDTSLEAHVDVRPFTGRYKNRFAHARRVIE